MIVMGYVNGVYMGFNGTLFFVTPWIGMDWNHWAEESMRYFIDCTV